MSDFAVAPGEMAFEIYLVSGPVCDNFDLSTDMDMPRTYDQ